MPPTNKKKSKSEKKQKNEKSGPENQPDEKTTEAILPAPTPEDTGKNTTVETEKLEQTDVEMKPVSNEEVDVEIKPPKKRTKKTKEEKAGKTIKKKTKRTLSSYVLFSMEYRKVINAEYPTLTLGEVSKKCGEKWKSMSDEEKSPWKEKADQIKAETIPEKKENEKKRKPSSYLMFSMQHRKVVIEQSPNLSLGEVSKKCGEAWKLLSQEEKDEWKVKAQNA